MPVLSYDDGAFGFFAITILAVYTVPASIYLFRTVSNFKETDDTPVRQGRSSEEVRKLQELVSARPKRTLWTLGFKLFALSTVLSAVALGVLVSTVGSEGQLAAYDPYSILGVDQGSSDREVQRAYRRLSLEHHPDKGGNAELFQKIAKAYEALSDPIARENWEKYGNPDGKQALEVGIGMPSILLHAQGRHFFFTFYLLILVVAIPIVMRRVWASTKGKTVFALSSQSLDWCKFQARSLHLEQRSRTLPETFGGLPEFRNLIYTPVQQQELIQHQEKLQDAKRPRISYTSVAAKDKKGNVIPGSVRDSVPFPYRFSVILLHAHMNRLAIRDPVLFEHLQVLLNNLLPFVRFNVQIGVGIQHEVQMNANNPNLDPSVARVAWLELSYAALRFGACVIHQLYGDDSSLLQVFTPEETSQILARKRGRDLGTLLRNEHPTDLDAVLTEACGARGTPRRTEVDAILRDLPIIDATVTVGVRKAQPEEDDEEEEEGGQGKGATSAAAAAGAVGAGAATTDAATTSAKKEKAKKGKKPVEDEDTEYEYEPKMYVGDTITLTFTIKHRGVGDKDTLPPVFAPRFPRELHEEWNIFLLDQRDKMLEVGEHKVGAGANERIEFGTIQRSIRTVKGKTRLSIMFPATTAKVYSYKVRVVSAVYVGLDFESPLETFEVLRDEDRPRTYYPDDDAEEAEGEDEEDAADQNRGAANLERAFLGGRKFVQDDEDLSDDEGETSSKKGNDSTSGSGAATSSDTTVATRAGAGAAPEAAALPAADADADDDWGMGMFKAGSKTGPGGGGAKGKSGGAKKRK